MFSTTHHFLYCNVRNGEVVKGTLIQLGMDIEEAVEAIKEEWDEDGIEYTEEEVRDFAVENMRDLIKEL